MSKDDMMMAMLSAMAGRRMIAEGTDAPVMFFSTAPRYDGVPEWFTNPQPEAEPVADLSWKEARPVGREETMREVMERQYRERTKREALEAKARPRQASPEEIEERRAHHIHRMHAMSMAEFDRQSAVEREAEREGRDEDGWVFETVGAGWHAPGEKGVDIFAEVRGKFARVMVRDMVEALEEHRAGVEKMLHWVPLHPLLTEAARKAAEPKIPKAPPVWRGIDLGRSHGKGQSIQAAFGRRK